MLVACHPSVVSITNECCLAFGGIDAVIKHVKTTRPFQFLEKLVSIHALNLARTRCDVLRRWLLLVFDMLWYVCIVQGMASVLKELWPWVHIWGSW